jgi:hypothetical protein
MSQEEIKVLNNKITEVIELCLDYGALNGSHYKMWIIDQIIRILSGDKYDALIKSYCKGEDGPNNYSWYTGVKP